MHYIWYHSTNIPFRLLPFVNIYDAMLLWKKQTWVTFVEVASKQITFHCLAWHDISHMHLRYNHTLHTHKYVYINMHVQNAHVYDCRCMYTYTCMYTYMYIYLSFFPSSGLSVHLPICLSTYLLLVLSLKHVSGLI